MESPWDAREGEEAAEPTQLSSPPCQGGRHVNEIISDTLDQSDHLLNITKWPESSPQGARQLPRWVSPEFLIHDIYKIVLRH